ncbi:MAG: MOSC domain-containing protein [Verrucomicrobiota bacterium]|nr:MOSC domain-containing protein [Verrucomicrobiota bacterium]
MPNHSENQAIGRVASLHIHPPNPGETMLSVNSITIETNAGIVGNTRYWQRQSRFTGKPTNRQISLIEREQIEEHANALGLPCIEAGLVRSNIETKGIDLVTLLNRKIRVGEATLYIAATRDPCHKMDKITPGLRERMMDNKQGVLARIVLSGGIRIGDTIQSID